MSSFRGTVLVRNAAAAFCAGMVLKIVSGGTGLPGVLSRYAFAVSAASLIVFWCWNIASAARDRREIREEHGTKPAAGSGNGHAEIPAAHYAAPTVSMTELRYEYPAGLLSETAIREIMANMRRREAALPPCPCHGCLGASDSWCRDEHVSIQMLSLDGRLSEARLFPGPPRLCGLCGLPHRLTGEY